MRKLFPLIALAFALCFTNAGCNSRVTLDPAGVYAGNTILFTAERTVMGTFSAFDSFLKWERANEVVLAKYPEVGKIADNIRANAQGWKHGIVMTASVYRGSPNEENRKQLQVAIELVEVVLTQALSELAKHQNDSPSVESIAPLKV